MGYMVHCYNYQIYNYLKNIIQKIQFLFKIIKMLHIYS